MPTVEQDMVDQEYEPQASIFSTGGEEMSTDSLKGELEKLRPLAELGRLATTIAHEVRNPLAGISANAELLRESITDPDDIEGLDLILAEVRRLGALVNDLMCYSRERDAAADLVDLSLVARGVVDLCRSDAELAGVALEVDGEGVTRGDAELTKQALLNLVRNALQASPADGLVTLKVSEGRIEIIDQGGGVPEPLRDTLFEPFVTGRTRGLGLGAAVARRCLRRQGGDVCILATGETGSTFACSWEQRS